MKTIEDVLILIDALTDVVAENEHTVEPVDVRPYRAAVVAALQGMAKNAERYRFWRDRYQITFPEAVDWTPERVDAATDNAMEQTP